MYNDEYKDLIGKTITNVLEDGESFTLIAGDTYKFFHNQDCCEDVYIYKIDGDLVDLIGETVTNIQEDILCNEKPDWYDDNETFLNESYTFTAISITTRDIQVSVTFLGTSNGYYSEGVDFNVS